MCPWEGRDDPEQGGSELHRHEDRGDDELGPRADVGSPACTVRRRVEDPTDSVRLGQQSPVHDAEAHAHGEPCQKTVRKRRQVVTGPRKFEFDA